MKEFKIIKEIKQKIRTVEDIKSEKSTSFPVQVKSEPEFIDDSPISKSRSSPSLDKIQESESVEDQTRFFQRDERSLREEDTRFYESTQRKENRMEYTARDLVGQVGVASSNASSNTADLTDRSSLLRTNRANALDSGPQTQSDRNYELKDDNDKMHVKRRKELY